MQYTQNPSFLYELSTPLFNPILSAVKYTLIYVMIILKMDRYWTVTNHLDHIISQIQ